MTLETSKYYFVLPLFHHCICILQQNFFADNSYAFIPARLTMRLFSYPPFTSSPFLSVSLCLLISLLYFIFSFPARVSLHYYHSSLAVHRRKGKRKIHPLARKSSKARGRGCVKITEFQRRRRGLLKVKLFSRRTGTTNVINGRGGRTTRHSGEPRCIVLNSDRTGSSLFSAQDITRGYAAREHPPELAPKPLLRPANRCGDITFLGSDINQNISCQK